eukprot:jgi/Botrbrau1/4074/Bobra.152_3s0029.1
MRWVVAGLLACIVLPRTSAGSQRRLLQNFQPSCPTTPSGIYQCVPSGFTPDSAPNLKVCVNLCVGPPMPNGNRTVSPCVNCKDPGVVCRQAHPEYGTAFTYAFVARGATKCLVPQPPPPAPCINKGTGNVGCGNVGDNNKGNNNIGSSNSGDGNVGSFNIGNKNQGSFNQGNCNKGDGNSGNNLAGNYLYGSGSNPCPWN